jgi:hypothetical protein
MASVDIVHVDCVVEVFTIAGESDVLGQSFSWCQVHRFIPAPGNRERVVVAPVVVLDLENDVLVSPLNTAD